MSSDFGNRKLDEILSLSIVNQKLLLDILNEIKDAVKELKDIEKNTGKKGKK